MLREAKEASGREVVPLLRRSCVCSCEEASA